MRTRVYAERCSQILVTWSWKSLGHDVGQHVRRFAVLQLDFATLDFITDMMVLNVNVLGTTMVDGIFRHLDARLVIFDDLELRLRLVHRCM